MESVFISFQMMYKSQFHKIDPCGPGHICCVLNLLYIKEYGKKYVKVSTKIIFYNIIKHIIPIKYK